jgi:FAD/FMN-containing dehydrogenase
MDDAKVSRRALLALGAGAAGLAVAGLPWSAAAQPRTNWETLRRRLTGDLVLPADAGYAQAKQLDSGYFDTVNPAAVAYCETTADVRACLLFAQDNDIRVAPRSGGHSSSGYSTTTGLVLDVSRFDAVHVGADTVTLGPGVQSVDAVAAVAAAGLSLSSGNGATVCAGGFLQGGGLGLQTRKFGIASDRLVSADVVLASGESVHCSAASHPDLFWALRGGGGGNFGVVTNFEIRPTTVTRQVSFTLSWPWESAADVYAAFQPWLAAAPDDLGVYLNFLHQVTGPDARPQVLVSGAWFGDPAALGPHLDELVAAVGSAPVSRTAEELTYQQAMMRIFGCADKTVQACHRVGANPAAQLPRRGYSVEQGRMVATALSGAAIAEALDAFAANPVTGQFRGMNLNALGGAVNRIGRTDTAYVHRTAQYYLSFSNAIAATTPTTDESAAIDAWLSRCAAVAAKYGNGESYVNVISPRMTDWRQAYYGENYPRLVRVKQAYDPHGFFRFAQSVGA